MRGHARRDRRARRQARRATSASCRRASKTVELEPAQIANGAVELLGEVSKSKITGEEERYSHTDLVDFEANVDGAAGGVRRRCARSSPTSDADARRRRSTSASPTSTTALEPYRTRRRLRLLHRARRPRDTRKLSQAIDALAEPLSQVGDDRRLARRERPTARPRRGRELLAAAARRRRRGARARRRRRRALAADDGDGASTGDTSRSTARTRPASRRRRRTGCTSPPSTSSPTRASDVRDMLRDVDEAAARDDRRRSPPGRSTTTRTRRPRTRARRSGSPAARLTVTFGLGPSLFDATDDRFGLASKRPRALEASCRRSRDDALDPRAAAATSASRPAPTTRRSRSTPCATSPASAAAAS